MERSISSRFYFDYNATSPLSKKVLDFLHSGEFLFGNPASLHQTGKKSRKHINETSSFLFNTFSLNPSEFDLFYHSGASEGINTVFKGMAFKAFKEKRTISFFFSEVDHAAVFNLKEDLESFGHNVFYFGVDHNGNFNHQELLNSMMERKKFGDSIAMNFTYINNETGVVWPLELAASLKEKTECFVHVDAVQLVGKISAWRDLNSDLDSYTFSGHKFGSMKGIGFTFLKLNAPVLPLIIGGTQQKGHRAGTENAFGVYSIKLALLEMIERFNPVELKSAHDLIEKEISHLGEIIGLGNKNRNLNTTFLMLKGQKAEFVSAKFDLMGIDLSTGSACSSGVIKENRVLMAMGYSAEDSRSALRFSFSPYMTVDEAKIYSSKIQTVLKDILK